VKPSFRTIRSVLRFSAVGTSAYVAHKGLDLSFPSIGVTTWRQCRDGLLPDGVVDESECRLDTDRECGAHGRFTSPPRGAGPDDGFSGYPNDNSAASGIARWGDYSAAVADGNKIWMAAEFIPSACDNTTYAGDSTCGGTRASEANWGTVYQ